VEIAVASPRSSASSTIAFSEKRAPERNSRSNCPLCCNSSIRPSVAITCWRTAAPSRRLSDDLQIGATARGLLAEIHGGEPDADSIVVRTDSAGAPEKSRKICGKRGTTFLCPLPLAHNHINSLPATRMRQLSKISRIDPHSFRVTVWDFGYFADDRNLLKIEGAARF